MKKHRFFTILCIIQMFSCISFSQDTTAIKKNNKPETHWSGFFKVAGFYQKGNTNKIFAVSSAEIKRSDGILESIAMASLDYGETDGLKDENDLYSSLTFDLFYDRTFSPFLLQLTEFGYTREIDLRSQTGGGLKYTFVNIPEIKTSISAAGIYDYTNLKDKPGNDDSRTWRLSARLKFHSLFFGGRIEITHVTFYQPSFRDFKNAILRSESELSMPLTWFLKITAAYLYKHEDVVPMGVKKSDHKLTFGLAVEFP